MRYTDLKIDKLISTFRILSILRILVLTMRVHGITSNYEEIFAEYKLRLLFVLATEHTLLCMFLIIWRQILLP